MEAPAEADNYVWRSFKNTRATGGAYDWLRTNILIYPSPAGAKQAVERDCQSDRIEIPRAPSLGEAVRFCEVAASGVFRLTVASGGWVHEASTGVRKPEPTALDAYHLLALVVQHQQAVADALAAGQPRPAPPAALAKALAGDLAAQDVETAADSAPDQDAPPVQAGRYRISGTVRDARTNTPVAGVQVVARTDHGNAGGVSGTAAAPEPAAKLATVAPASVAPGAAAPSAGAVQRGGGVRALGAPGVPDQPAGSSTSSGGTSGIVGTGVTLPVYEFKAETDTNGAYRLDPPAGAAHRVSLTMTCFAGQEFLVSETTRRDVRFEAEAAPFTTPLAAGTFRVYGQAKDQNGRPVAGACVVATGPAGSTPPGLTLPTVTKYMTDESGTFLVEQL